MRHQKWKMLISGHVQGVGFRYTASQVASRREMSGWVRNLSDGRVELLIQGHTTVLIEYMEALEQAIHGRISDIDKVVEEPDPALRDFEIRR